MVSINPLITPPPEALRSNVQKVANIIMDDKNRQDPEKASRFTKLLQREVNRSGRPMLLLLDYLIKHISR